MRPHRAGRSPDGRHKRQAPLDGESRFGTKSAVGDHLGTTRDLPFKLPEPLLRNWRAEHLSARQRHKPSRLLARRRTLSTVRIDSASWTQQQSCLGLGALLLSPRVVGLISAWAVVGRWVR